MRQGLVALTGIFLLLFTVLTTDAQHLESVLRFEEPTAGQSVSGWGGGPPGTIHLDTVIVRTGRGAARLEREADSPSAFSSITNMLPIDFGGEWIELRGYLRTEGVTEFAGLWLREDGASRPVQFANMQDRGLRGTTDWTEYSIRLPLDDEARDLYYGVLVAGEGTVWADDLQLLVDGEPLDQAPQRVVEPTILETDTEFDGGSGIAVSTLSERQVENLAVLGKVWGFLKYHHPRVAAGEVHWDYELFRVLPQVLDAAGADDRNRILAAWVTSVGEPQTCDPCAELPHDAHLYPRLDWIEDEAVLGAELSGRLQTVYDRRFAGSEQMYVSQVGGVGNPVFEADLSYAEQQPPDAGFRMLALLRFWNIIEYWFPYRDQIDADWDAVLRDFLPRFAAADTWDAYQLELLALIAKVEDTHANLWSSLDVRPPRGECRWPVELRFIEGRPTVTAYSDDVNGPPSGLEVGDVLEVIDGRTVDALVEAWSPYYSASNEPTRLRDIARSMPRGECGESTLAIERRGRDRTIVVDRISATFDMPIPHDRPGETFQMLSDDVAYVKLSGIRVEDIPGYLERAAGTRGLVIDIRNYPSEFVVFALGQRLVDVPTPFARFTVGDPSNPGTFTWTQPLVLQPDASTYDGRVAILVDETSISQAEYTAMALSAGPNALVVGSTTAGADGNVSPIPLPGGLRTMISGIGVFYPDKTPTQKVGIVPDIEARPTVEGFRDGRDEVLEAALRHILGSGADEAAIREMAARDADR